MIVCEGTDVCRSDRTVGHKSGIFRNLGLIIFVWICALHGLFTQNFAVLLISRISVHNRRPVSCPGNVSLICFFGISHNMLIKSDNPVSGSVDCRSLIVIFALALPGAGVSAAVLTPPSLPDLLFDPIAAAHVFEQQVPAPVTPIITVAPDSSLSMVDQPAASAAGPAHAASAQSSILSDTALVPAPHQVSDTSVVPAKEKCNSNEPRNSHCSDSDQTALNSQPQPFNDSHKSALSSNELGRSSHQLTQDSHEKTLHCHQLAQNSHQLGLSSSQQDLLQSEQHRKMAVADSYHDHKSRDKSACHAEIGLNQGRDVPATAGSDPTELTGAGVDITGQTAKAKSSGLAKDSESNTRLNNHHASHEDQSKYRNSDIDSGQRISAPAFYSSQIKKNQGRSWAVSDDNSAAGDPDVAAAHITNRSSYKGPAAAHAAAVRAAQKEKLPSLNEEYDYRPNLYGTDLPDHAAAAQNRKMRESQHKHRNAQSVSSHQGISGDSHPDLPYDHSLVYASSDEIDTDIDLQEMADSMRRSRVPADSQTQAAAQHNNPAVKGSDGGKNSSAVAPSGAASASAGAAADAGASGARRVGAGSFAGAAGTGAQAFQYENNDVAHDNEHIENQLQWTDEFMDAYMSSYGGDQSYESSTRTEKNSSMNLEAAQISRPGMFAGTVRLGDYIQKNNDLDKLLEDEQKREPEQRYYSSNVINHAEFYNQFTNHSHDSLRYGRRHDESDSLAFYDHVSAHGSNKPAPSGEELPITSTINDMRARRAVNELHEMIRGSTDIARLQKHIRQLNGVDDSHGNYSSGLTTGSSGTYSHPMFDDPRYDVPRFIALDSKKSTTSSLLTVQPGQSAKTGQSANAYKPSSEAASATSESTDADAHTAAADSGAASGQSDESGAVNSVEESYTPLEGDREVLGEIPSEGEHWSEVPELKRARSRSEDGVPGIGGPTLEQVAMGVYLMKSEDSENADIDDGEEHKPEDEVCAAKVKAPTLTKPEASSEPEHSHNKLMVRTHARNPVTFTRLTSYSLRFREDPFLSHGDLQKESSSCINGRGYSCYLAGRHYDALASMERNNKKRLQAAEDLAHAHDNYPGAPIPGAVFDHLLHSIVFFRRGCHLKHSLSCRLLLSTYGRYGGIIAMGKTTIANRQLGSRYLETGCNFEEPRSCANLAAMYINGYAGFEPDTQKGIELYLRSCRIARTITNELRLIDPNLGIGCLELGRIYLNGAVFPDNTTVSPDYVKAHRYLHQACSLRSNTACKLIRTSFDDHDNVGESVSGSRRQSRTGPQSR